MPLRRERIVTIIRLHHKIFLAYSSVFLIAVGGIFVIASYFIRATFDDQISADAKQFRGRISETLDQLVRDIDEKVQSEITDPDVVGAIRRRETNPTTIKDSVLEILEYGNVSGEITASQSNLDLRRGERDLDALDRASGKTLAYAIRIRSDQSTGDIPQAILEVTLPVGSLGFVTGGYTLQDRLKRIFSRSQMA